MLSIGKFFENAPHSAADIADTLSISPIHEKDEDFLKMDNPEIQGGLNFSTLQRRSSRLL
jgi:hypothetical protein